MKRLRRGDRVVITSSLPRGVLRVVRPTWVGRGWRGTIVSNGRTWPHTATFVVRIEHPRRLSGPRERVVPASVLRKAKRWRWSVVFVVVLLFVTLLVHAA